MGRASKTAAGAIKRGIASAYTPGQKGPGKGAIENTLTAGLSASKVFGQKAGKELLRGAVSKTSLKKAERKYGTKSIKK